MSERKQRPAHLGRFKDPELARQAGKASAASRAEAVRRTRKATAPASCTIVDLMDAAGMHGTDWTPWRAFWKAVYALPMTGDELAAYQRHTSRAAPPTKAVAEAWMVIGRGGGKTRNSALHTTYRAITFDASRVAPGEDVIIPLLASNQRQAQIALKYVRALSRLDLVRPYVHRGELRAVIEYTTGVNAEVSTANTSATRGYSCPCASCDEIAFWTGAGDDASANPDSEVLTAVRGSLGRVRGSVLCVLSNPAAPSGELYDAHERYFGTDTEHVLVWNADTASMNPTYDPDAIARAFVKDAVVAASEFGSDGRVTFRQASSAMFDRDTVEACIVQGRHDLAPDARWL